MIRRCDGSDPNLTRELTEAELIARPQPPRLSPWNSSAKPDHAVICCDCGLSFDDTFRLTRWPHERV